jgi:hypothetical protein
VHQCHQRELSSASTKCIPTDDDDDTSTMNHTGKMASPCSCQKNSTCLKCNGCKSTALVIVICNSLTSGGFTQTTDSREILRVPPGRQGGEIEYLKKLKSGWSWSLIEKTLKHWKETQAFDKLRKEHLAATGERKQCKCKCKGWHRCGSRREVADADRRNWDRHFCASRGIIAVQWRQIG